jgi:WD40 repeat protein
MDGPKMVPIITASISRNNECILIAVRHAGYELLKRQGAVLGSDRRYSDARLVSAAMSTDGRKVLEGMVNGDTIVRDIDNGRVRVCSSPVPYIYCLAFSADGEGFVTSARDGLRVWNPLHSTIPHFWPRTGMPVTFISWLSGRIVTCTDDGLIETWDPVSEKRVSELRTVGQPDLVTSFACTVDGRYALVCSRGIASVWDMRSGQVRRVFVPQPEAQQLAFLSGDISQDGSTVVAGDLNGSASLWDIETGERIGRLDVSALGASDCPSYAP